MSAAIDGQLSAFDLPGAEPAPAAAPPFMVNLSAWQPRACGWCKKSNTIGGAATRHPTHHGISIFYEYCERCCDRYGSPRPGQPGFQFWVNEQPCPDAEKQTHFSEKMAAWRTLTTKGKS